VSNAPDPSAHPPTVPNGSLTVPPSANDVLTYLGALRTWTQSLRAALDNLDARVQVARDPGSYTQDIVLAMSLWNSIDGRRRELEQAWDSGRVGPNELATIATLIWGRLSDPLGRPSAFTLPEACTLAAALQDRLSAAVAGDAIAGSGAAARIDPVRAAIIRCREQAEALGVPTARIDELSAELEAAIASADPQKIAATVAAVDTETTIIERDLIKEAGMRAGRTFQAAEVRRRYDDAATKAARVSALAQQCREKIADPPRLAVPSIAVLGEPPVTRPGETPAERDAGRRELTEYARRLGRFAAALAEAETRFSAPLEEREDLRGLLGAYRKRAAANGLAEDLALADHYQAAHDVLWSAPCDLATARTLVGHYQHAVRVAVGAERVVEPTVQDGSRGEH